MKTKPSQIATLITLLLAPAVANSAIVVDQSFTSPTSLYTFFANPRIAQTFTAGIDGNLVGVNLDLLDDVPLSVAIYDTVGGQPANRVLAEATVPGPVSFATFIEFSSPVRMVAGNQYAIVVSQPQAVNPMAAWVGAAGSVSFDYYPGGQEWVQTGPADNPVWGFYESYDLHFRTYVEPLPIAELIPCEGPSQGEHWRNHSQYLAAVTEAVRHYLEIGAITKSDAISIIRDAAQSDCGKRVRRP